MHSESEQGAVIDTLVGLLPYTELNGERYVHLDDVNKLISASASLQGSLGDLRRQIDKLSNERNELKQQLDGATSQLTDDFVVQQAILKLLSKR